MADLRKTLIEALQHIVNGEPTPSFFSDDLEEVLAALSLFTISCNKEEYAAFGCAALRILLDRLLAGMHAERAVVIMRDNSIPLC